MILFIYLFVGYQLLIALELASVRFGRCFGEPWHLLSHRNDWFIAAFGAIIFQLDSALALFSQEPECCQRVNSPIQRKSSHNGWPSVRVAIVVRRNAINSTLGRASMLSIYVHQGQIRLCECVSLCSQTETGALSSNRHISNYNCLSKWQYKTAQAT